MEVVSFTNPGAALQKYLNTIDANLTNEITDPGNAGTIGVTNSGTLLLTSGVGAETRTLPSPTFVGQKMDICMDVDGGGNISVSTVLGFDPAATNDTLVFSVAGQSARIYAVREGDALVWRVLRADFSEPTLS